MFDNVKSNDLEIVSSIYDRIIEGLNNSVDIDQSVLLENIIKKSQILTEKVSSLLGSKSQTNILIKSDDHNQKIDMHDPPKISFKSFHIGDIALFFPANAGKDIYIAFHSGCPHRYLSISTLQTFRQNKLKNIDAYVLGKIIFMEKFVANINENPYNLSIGTEYHIIDVESVN